jgi:hypothetical protein
MSTETLLQGVIGELQKTNALIERGNKDPSLGSSIKQNLGEILNASRLQKDTQSYTEKKGIDQTDDEVKKLNKQTEEDSTVLKEILNSVIAISEGQPTQSQQQSIKKKEEAKEQKFIEGLFGIEKKIGGYFDKLGKLFDGKGGTLLKFLGLFGLVQFLQSESFIKLLGALDFIILKIEGAGKAFDDFMKKTFNFNTNLEELGPKIAKIALVSAAIFALLNPIKTLKSLLLSLPTAIISKGFKAVRTFFGMNPQQLAKKSFVGPQKASRGFRVRQALGRTREFVSGVGNKISSGVRTAGSTIAGYGKSAGSAITGLGSKLGPLANIGTRGALVGLGRAAAIATGPIGLAIMTGITGIIGGVKAGMKKAEDETATKMDIAKAALVGGAVGILTLGMGTPEGVSKFFGGIGDKIGEKFTAFKEMLPTKDELKEKMAGFAEGLKGKLTELGDKFSSLKDSMITKFEDITGFELPSFEEVSEKLKNFGTNLKNRVLDAIPTKEKVKEFGSKILQFGKDLIKKDATQEQIDAAVTAALQKHFEIAHSRNEEINDNALNKSGGGETIVVNNISQDNSNDVKQEVVNNFAKEIAHKNPLHNDIAFSN